MTSSDTPTASHVLSGWDLSELLPNTEDDTVDQAITLLEHRVQSFEELRMDLEELAGDSERLLVAVKDYEAILKEAFSLSGYGSLWFSADTQSQDALTYRNRIQQILTGIQNRLLFFSLWWQGLDGKIAEQRLAELEADPANADYVFYLQDVRRLARYKLEESNEKIINLKDADGISAVMTLYSMITNALEYSPAIKDENGEPIGPLTRDALMAHAYSTDPKEREAAYKELYRVYGDNSKVLSQMYVNRVRDWYNENIELRGYGSAINVRNVANDVPDEAVDALLEVIQENASIFQRYFKLKGSWLAEKNGYDKLKRYDIYAPLAESGEKIAYDEAVERVLESFGSFHPEFLRHGKRVFDEDHIDSEPRPGKRGGAFCATITPELTPWVLVNYTGKLRDVATLAHEMGHAVHSMLAEDHSLLTQHPSLPLAETASVFAEILMTDKLLAEQDDPLAKRELLASAVDDMYATVMRQAFFVLFERDAHAAILEGKSPAELNEIYMENLRLQFGDSIELSDEFQHEWISIPHIYSTPFYCYAYSFGQLLVLALYRRYQEQGEEFKPGYLKLLAYGGSQHPELVLREAGVEITDKAFWQGGFDVITEMIEQLEAL